MHEPIYIITISMRTPLNRWPAMMRQHVNTYVMKCTFRGKEIINKFLIHHFANGRMAGWMNFEFHLIIIAQFMAHILIVHRTDKIPRTIAKWFIRFQFSVRRIEINYGNGIITSEPAKYNGQQITEHWIIRVLSKPINASKIKLGSCLLSYTLAIVVACRWSRTHIQMNEMFPGPWPANCSA